MTEDLKFHFPIATLLREGDLITTAAEGNAAINPRLPTGHTTATRALIDTVTGDVNAMKNKKGGIGDLTDEQNAALDELNKWTGRAKQTAGLAFKGQAVKLREQFQVGVNDHFDLANIVNRANIILGSVKDPANLAALKTKGWIDADTTAFAAAVSALTSADTTQEGGISGGLDATTVRNHDANALYENLQTIQNAADLQWPADVPANTGVRAAFRMDVFPPRGGNGSTPVTPPTPAPATSTPAK
jgi:hypothetical protein